MSFSLEASTPSRKSGGRFRISRTARRQSVVLLAVAIAPFLGVSPVGNPLLDGLWSSVFAGYAALLGTTSKRGPLIVAAVVAVAGAHSSTAVVFGALAVLAAALSTRNLKRRAVFARGSSGAFTAFALLGTGGANPIVLGVTAAVSISILVISGYRHVRTRTRRNLRWVAWALSFAVVGAAGLAAVGVISTASQMRLGSAELKLGFAAARRGNAPLASAHLQLAQHNLERAHKRLNLMGAPSRLFPIGAQQVDSIVDVLGAVEGAATEARRGSEVVDDGSLNVRAGTLDLSALAALHTPLERLDLALQDVIRQVDIHDDDPLVPLLRDRLDELRTEAARAQIDAHRGATASAVLPTVFGVGGPRHYLVVFTSPAEARGRFGFPASFAEITFDNGRFLLGEHGSTSQLITGLQVDQTPFDLGDPQLRPYVPYGATRELLASTIPPDFPTVARSVREMWRQSGRTPLDGVVRFDPTSLARLLALTGPVQIDGVPQALTTENLERFLLVGQYVQFPSVQAPRRELLSDVADITFERLETADLGAPRLLFDLFTPMVRDGHLQVSMADPAAEDFVAMVGMNDPFTDPAVDGLAVTTVNGLGNKIDSFLTKSQRYTGTVADGKLEGTVTVELRNSAPAADLPDYVIGSFAKPAPPKGTNRVTVFVYTGVESTGVLVDGQPVQSLSSRTGGRWIHQLVVEMPPGGTATIEIRLKGELPEGRYRLQLDPSGGTAPDDVTVDLQVDGRRLNYEGRPETMTVLK